MRYAHYELFDAGNVDAETGGVLDPGSERAHANRGNALWHVDSSFNPRRASFSLLRACELPPPGHGGNTDFADSRTAFDELPADLRDELRLGVDDDDDDDNDNDGGGRDGGGLVGVHSHMHSRKLGSPEFFADVDPAAGPAARHRVAQRHEPSGRMNLYVGAHLCHAEDGDGREVPGSWDLVQRLNRHASQPKYTVSVRWDRPGDLVIWDNRCVLHRAGPGTFEGRFRRDMRRTTVHDDSPTAWGLNPKDLRWNGNYVPVKSAPVKT